MEDALREYFISFIQARRGCSDEMDPQLAGALLQFIKDEVRASIFADPEIASRLRVVRASAAGQLDALKAYMEKNKDELVGLPSFYSKLQYVEN
jgi:hypothetical protein